MHVTIGTQLSDYETGMAQTYDVDIQNMAFEPASLTIAAGDTVTWTNRMGLPHTVAPDNGEFPGSGPLGQDQTFSHVFEDAGTVNYHCEIHNFMKGTVTAT